MLVAGSWQWQARRALIEDRGGASFFTEISMWRHCRCV
jgi:hypothetical protein